MEFDLPAGSTPAGLTAGPDGRISFANQARGSIGAITTARGVAGEQPISTPGGDAGVHHDGP